MINMNRLMDKRELISIIIPVYNVKPYLTRCFETITLQSYQYLEIILVDDGSTDGSEDICDSLSKMDSRCVVIHQSNQGLWAARNSGQKLAKGNYIMFVDSDDYLHVDAVKCLYEALVNHPECGLSMCKYKRTTSLEEDISIKEKRPEQVISVEQLLNLSDNFLPDIVWNKLYRRSLIEGIWAREYRIAQDVDYNFRVYMNLEMAVLIDSELYFWMQRCSSAMHQNNYRFSYLKIVTEICHRNYLECPNDLGFLKAYFLQRLYSRLLLLRLYAWKTEEMKSVILHFNTCICDTWRSYMFCRRISLIERVSCLILLKCSPRFICLLMYIRRKLI